MVERNIVNFQTKEVMYFENKTKRNARPENGPFSIQYVVTQFELSLQFTCLIKSKLPEI